MILTVHRRIGISLFVLLFAAPFASAQSTPLLNGKDLLGWESIGDGVWNVLKDGTLVGQRDLRKKSANQAWLYTKKDFGEFDLHLEWWLRLACNSGISIRDSSRARYAIEAEWDPKRTPAHIGYEIQLINGYKESFPSGSVYLFDKAKEGMLKENDWNTMDIESRKDAIRVKINGELVSQYAGDPARPTTGPIGLQLHDKNTVVMFRDVKIRELKAK